MHAPENFEYLTQFFKLSKKFNLGRDYHKVLERDEFYLDKWLVRPGIVAKGLFTHDEVNEARQFMSLLYNGDFYQDLPPTNFASSLAMVSKSAMIKQITVVSRTISGREELNESKIAFINGLFNGSNSKVEILLLDENEKKSDLIGELGDGIGFIYEDELSNIIDIVDKCDNLEKMNIMIPSYGYNTNLPQDVINKAKNKNIDIKYYFDR